MLSPPSRLRPLLPLILRAVGGYLLLRPLLVIVALLLAEFAGPEVAASMQSPLGVVLIAGAVGAADIRRRRESILWANLGYPAIVPPALFAIVALLGELALASWRN